MKFFVSSLIRGFEAFREAATVGVTTLGQQAVRAEDFPASVQSPQQACLAGVRDADTIILILGERYGEVQASGLSATHEEYREARDIRPVLVFIEQGITPDLRQEEFIREVQGWEHGHFTAQFQTPDELREKVTRAVHGFVLTNEAAPVDEEELLSRARAAIPSERSTVGTDLLFVVAGAPLRAVLRPAELESVELRRFLLAEALTGVDAVLTPASGTGE